MMRELREPAAIEAASCDTVGKWPPGKMYLRMKSVDFWYAS